MQKVSSAPWYLSWHASPRFFWRKTETLVEDECYCHRLMSRLPSQLLPALWSALLMVLWKKGCLRAADRVRRFVGSYSSMASIRSNSWWCSSASDRRYLWEREKGDKEYQIRALTYHPDIQVHLNKLECRVLNKSMHTDWSSLTSINTV